MCSENILFYYLKAVKLVLLSDRAGPGLGQVRCLGPKPYEGQAKASTSGPDPGPSRVWPTLGPTGPGPALGQCKHFSFYCFQLPFKRSWK